MPKRVWASILYELSLEQEWSNFKDEAQEYQGQRGAEYVHALHQVWSVMHSLQRAERRQR